MNKCILLLVALLCSLFSCYVHGGESSDVLSKEEELELVKQFTVFNKAVIKTVQIQNGDLYDCVDFYDQPAFDHPSLKNHTFHPQMRPTSLPKRMRQGTNSNNQEIEFMLVDCPFGAVPIKRFKKDEFMKMKLRELDNNGPVTYLAVVETMDEHPHKYLGGGGAITIYNITVKPSQYSLSRIEIKGGPDSIQVGLTTNLDTYGTLDTHMFIRTKIGQMECFNMWCSGFVLVNPIIPVDAIVGPASQRGGLLTFLGIFIHRDPSNGNWWVEVGDDTKSFQLGFWPKSVFSPGGLQDLATYISWGGETSSPAGVPSPPMGASDFLSRDFLTKFKKNAFCKLLTTVNEANEEVDANPADTIRFLNEYLHHGAADLKFREYDRHVMLFGGPGGALSL